jgi:hypothetical protein
MNAEIQKKLVALADEAGMNVESAQNMPPSFCGCQHTQAPIAIIDPNQPQHEQIFTFLHELGHFVLHYKHSHPVRMPWYLNRPYKNEILGEAAYATRRALRLKLGKEWQADLWAMCLFCQLGCPDDLKAFLKQHPEKRPLFYLAVVGHVKTRIGKSIHKLFHLYTV